MCPVPSTPCLRFIFFALSMFDYLSTFLSQGESHSTQASAHEIQLSSEERKQKWEQGQADYMGKDSFDNIRKKLDTFLK